MIEAVRSFRCHEAGKAGLPRSAAKGVSHLCRMIASAQATFDSDGCGIGMTPLGLPHEIQGGESYPFITISCNNG